MPVSGAWRETDHTPVPSAERQSPHLAGQVLTAASSALRVGAAWATWPSYLPHVPGGCSWVGRGREEPREVMPLGNHGAYCVPGTF